MRLRSNLRGNESSLRDDNRSGLALDLLFVMRAVKR